jgi:hypothetical protein
MSNSTLFDAGIPVLTEIIQAPVDAADKPPPDEAETQEPPKVVDVPAIDGWLTEEWNRLERKIGGRILDQVMARLESGIEDRVRDALADVLQAAVENLAADIKQNLQHSLQEVISQAVRDEVFRMQTAKK